MLIVPLLVASLANAASDPSRSKGNPIAPHIFLADPAAHVWPQAPDTLWVYTSHDHPGTNHYDTMTDYHVLSTKDLVNWTDHGQVLSVENVPWAASHAWAPDAVFFQGKYYLVFPMKEKRSGVFMVGLAESDRPEGPFHDTGYIAGSDWGQDPALFIDDDGQPYLYWGHDYMIHGAKLAADLRSIVPGSVVNLTPQLRDAFEGPWINKIDGKYHLSYASLAGRRWPETLSYAISDSPLGPYASKGEYLGKFGQQSDTVHGSIVKFKDRYVSFYHSSWGSAGNSETRNLMAEFLEREEDGSWRPMSPSSNGVSGGKGSFSRVWIEAENGTAAGGKLIATEVESNLPGYSGRGYVTGFPVKKENSKSFQSMEKECPSCTKRASVGSVTVLVQTAHEQDYRLIMRYSADQATRLHVFVNRTLIKGASNNANDPICPATGAQFSDFDLGVVRLSAGDNFIRLHTRDNADLRVDAFELTPQYKR